MPGENRAILLTAPGSAALAVVRLVGRDVDAFLARHCDKPIRPGRCVHAEVIDEHREVIDDPVIVRHNAGADISLHGGAWVVSRFLDLCRGAGFPADGSSADPRRFDAADLIEREMLEHLIRAVSRLGIELLLAQPRIWRDRATKLTAGEARAALADRTLEWLLSPPRVAIVGDANAGKSTLANRLFAEDRSITSDSPGTTRDWVEAMAEIDGLVIRLIDTPGTRPTEDPIERAAMELSAEEVAGADLLIHVMDVTAPRPAPYSAGAIIVANKIDRPALWQPGPDDVPTVAIADQGTDRLRALIRARFLTDPHDRTRLRCWTTRQRAILQCLAAAAPPAPASVPAPAPAPADHSRHQPSP